MANQIEHHKKHYVEVKPWQTRPSSACKFACLPGAALLFPLLCAWLQSLPQGKNPCLFTQCPAWRGFCNCYFFSFWQKSVSSPQLSSRATREEEEARASFVRWQEWKHKGKHKAALVGFLWNQFSLEPLWLIKEEAAFSDLPTWHLLNGQRGEPITVILYQLTMNLNWKSFLFFQA